MKKGKINYFANQFIKGFSIPIFEDNKINKLINKRIKYIKNIKSLRKYRNKKYDLSNF